MNRPYCKWLAAVICFFRDHDYTDASTPLGAVPDGRYRCRRCGKIEPIRARFD